MAERTSSNRTALAGALLIAAAFGAALGGCAAATESAAEQLADGAEEGLARVAEMLALPVPDAEVVEAAFELLEEAVEEWQDGDPAVGALRADSALALLPTLADWRPVIRAEMLAVAGDTARVRESLAEIDREGEVWSRWGWRGLVTVHEEAGDVEGAWVAARTAAENEWRTGRQAGAWMTAGRLAIAAGDSTFAREHLWSALAYGERYAGGREAAHVLDRFPEEWTPEEEVQIGRALLAGGSWDRGYRRLRPYVEGGALSAGLEDELRLEAGRALYQMGRHADARSLLEPLAWNGSVSPELASSALYWKGRSALERGSIGDAERAFRELARVTPESPFAEEGFRLLLSEELETGFGSRARGFLDDLLSVGVASPTAELAVVQAGTARYMEGDLDEAALIFERYREASRSSSGRQQAAYWEALTQERAGVDVRDRLAAVHRDNPLSFYGVAAGDRIGAPVFPADLQEGPSAVPGIGLEIENAIIRLRAHRLVPTPGSFSFEVDRLTEHFLRRGDGAYDFAEALIEEGFALQGILIGREIRRREGEWNLRSLRIVHPFPFRDEIVAQATAHGLDPFFVAGLIRQESMFDARIQSPAGAVGLMQLMPATAQQTARGLGLEYSPEALIDPAFNVQLGTNFLAGLVQRFDGRAEDALAAYNAGPTRMRQWQQRPMYGDRDVFMEHVPFRETRHYVKVVQQYARIYTALYGCGDFEPCPGLSYPEAVASSEVAGGRPSISLTR